MSEIVRFGVSIEQDLLENYDRLIAERGYATRSEALRDLIRESLIQEKSKANLNTQVLGSLTLVYDHHASNLLQEMARSSARFSRSRFVRNAHSRQPRGLYGNSCRARNCRGNCRFSR